MSGHSPSPPAVDPVTRRARVESNRLERAVELLVEAVELLRCEIDQARDDGPQPGRGDHGEHFAT